MNLAYRNGKGSRRTSYGEADNTVAGVNRRRRRSASKIVVAVGAAAIASTVAFGGYETPTVAAGQVSPQTHAVVLASDASFEASLKMLLDSIPVTGPNGGIEYLGPSSLSNVLEYGYPFLNPKLGDLFTAVGLNDPSAAEPTSGITTTLNELLNVLNVGQITPINDLLATLPVGQGDAAITGATSLGTILTSLQVEVPNSPQTIDLGNVTVNNLLALIALPSGDATLSDATTLGALLDEFPSIANISLPDLTGGFGGLSGILGDLLPSAPTTVGGLVEFLGLQDDTLGSLLNFTSATDLSDLAQIAGVEGVSLDSLLAELGPENGVTLAGSSTLDQITDFFGIGDKTLAELLPGAADLTNNSTLVDLLNDTALFGNIGAQSINELLGLTSATAGDAAGSLF